MREAHRRGAAEEGAAASRAQEEGLDQKEKQGQRIVLITLDDGVLDPSHTPRFLEDMTDNLRDAAAVLLNGGIVAYPTEAVFGLGCDPMNEAAVERLLTLKGRARSKGLILIAADYTQLRHFIGPLETSHRERILQSWPGPFTWVVPAADSVPEWVRGEHESLAVRVTAHPIAAELCRAAGMAIISTSANVSGHPPARSAQEVREQFGDSVDFVLDGELGGLSRPTEIRDAVTGTVLRAGSQNRGSTGQETSNDRN